MGPLRGVSKLPGNAPVERFACERAAFRKRAVGFLANSAFMRAARRGGTTVACMLSASPALAEVCDKIRPGWDGAPASMLDEAIALMSTPPSLVLLLASALAIRLRHQWGALAVLIGWTIWISLLVFPTPDAAELAAIAEGCIGSPILFIAVVAAICVAMILYTIPRPKRED